MRPIPYKFASTPADDARIVHAAVRAGEWVFLDWRHSDIINDQLRARALKTKQDDQGFVDQHGCFWSRYKAARIAHRSGQIAEIPNVLTSEDLWDKHGEPRVPGQPWEPCS